MTHSHPLADMNMQQFDIFSVITMYPLILQLGGLFPHLTPGPHLVNWSNVSEVSCLIKEATTTPKGLEQELSLQPLN